MEEDEVVSFTIKQLGGRTESFELPLNSTTETLLTIASDCFNVPEDQFSLILNGRKLRPGDTLQSIGLTNGARIVMSRPHNRRIQHEDPQPESIVDVEVPAREKLITEKPEMFQKLEKEAISMGKVIAKLQSKTSKLYQVATGLNKTETEKEARELCNGFAEQLTSLTQSVKALQEAFETPPPKPESPTQHLFTEEELAVMNEDSKRLEREDLPKLDESYTHESFSSIF